MKKVTEIRFTALLMVLVGIMMFSTTNAQTTTWFYEAANGSDNRIQIKTTGSNSSVSKVNLGKKGDTAWTETEILSMSDYESYIRVKSKASGKVYELNINWGNGKIIMTLPDGSHATYWLKES
ncbi:MAG: hypothetical protein ACJASQ_000091 [Crocinitomicaceae bacterium]|jgi:hypothetical protein